MHFVLFDGPERSRLLPFTHTRPVALLRCGIFTMQERWEHLLTSQTSCLTENYLQAIYPISAETDTIYINGALFASEELLAAVEQLPGESALYSANELIALRSEQAITEPAQLLHLAQYLTRQQTSLPVLMLRNAWDLFALNDTAIRQDFERITSGRTSAAIPAHVTALNPEQIFIEEGALLAPCIINAGTGPVYVGAEAEIMEGAVVRGPLALCSHAALKMGAKVYGATTIGPGSKVGGEVNNVVFFNNSNKGHDGFIGNAVIGEWCNLGADTNCSNLKNNYDFVKIWSETEQKLIPTGLQFCGLLMGDHSKCGINTMFNTGTVVGVSCNIYGSGFPDKFVPSFSWGSSDEMTTYKPEKAMETANRMMERRGKQLSEGEKQMFLHLFEQSAAQRQEMHNA
jgi:UDP-N-acetylglucosamine diphosphorylase/glucosamine-1-phosphate N-acetyltransferase